MQTVSDGVLVTVVARYKDEVLLFANETIKLIGKGADKWQACRWHKCWPILEVLQKLDDWKHWKGALQQSHLIWRCELNTLPPAWCLLRNENGQRKKLIQIEYNERILTHMQSGIRGYTYLLWATTGHAGFRQYFSWIGPHNSPNWSTCITDPSRCPRFMAIKEELA